MKKGFVLLMLFLIYGLVQAQWKWEGVIFTSGYMLETDDGQTINAYPGLMLKGKNLRFPSQTLHLFGRGIYEDQKSEFSEKVYYLYLQSTLGSGLQLKAGRQFVYDGVINGTLDGVALQYKGAGQFTFRLYGGLQTPLNRQLEFGTWSEDRFYGFSISGEWLEGQRVQFSTVRKWLAGERSLALDGLLFNGLIRQKWMYLWDLQYNPAEQAVQRNLMRIMYIHPLWNASVEYIHQLPMVYEFSYFNRFEINAYDQYRISAGRKIKGFDASIGYRYTVFEEENTSEWNVEIMRNRNSVGLLINTDYAGDNFGLYGQVFAPIMKNLALRFYGNYFSYQRYAVDISEEAVSLSGGLEWNPGSYLFRMDIQQMSNDRYNHDVRLYVHLQKTFGK